MFTVDIIIILLLLIMAFFGFSKGLVMQLACFIALAAGITVSYFFWEKSYLLIQQWLNYNHYVLKSIAVGGTITVVTLLILIIGKIISKIISITPFGIFNKLFGMILGIAQMVLFLSFLILALLYINPDIYFLQDNYLSQSYVLPYIKPVAPYLLQWFF